MSDEIKPSQAQRVWSDPRDPGQLVPTVPRTPEQRARSLAIWRVTAELLSARGFDLATEWPSGFIGECAICGRSTIVRGFGDDMLGEPTEYLCRPCHDGYDDADDVECTCDLMAHPCEVHDCRGGAPDEVRGPDWTSGETR